MHILAFLSIESFKRELVLQDVHNELTQVKQFEISVHKEQVIRPPEDTNA